MNEPDPWLSKSGIAVKLKITIASLAICCALIFLTSVFGQEATIAWRADLDEAKRQAASENKLVLVHFWGSFCRPCLNLEKFVFTNPRVGNAINKLYVPVKIDVESQPAIAKEFGITTIPHDVVITPSGQVLAKRASSSNADGYLNSIQSVAQRAARANPLAIANANQIAEAAPAVAPQITNAFVPAGQSSAVPEPIRVIGNSAPNLDSPIKTVGGQLLMPTAQDERKLSSPPPAEQFLDELRMTAPANATAESAASNSANPQESARPAPTSRPSQILRPLSDIPIQGPARTQMPQGQRTPPVMTIQNPLAVASEAIQSASDTATSALSKSSPTTISPQVISAHIEDSQPTSTQASDQCPIDINQKPPIGFGGSCPGTWFATGKFVHGDPQWGCEHRGRLYLFASRELRDQFSLTPDVLSPMLAGYDPVAYSSNGALVDGSLSYPVVVEANQRKTLYLFSSAENKTIFLDNSQKYIDDVRQAIRAADQAAVNR